MRVVNPKGRVAEKVNSSANYINPLAGCICSGPEGTAVSYNQGTENCKGVCGHGPENMVANAELAKTK